jgi:FtsP/CotA-like multicopper oxidase with cupredoxin domain
MPSTHFPTAISGLPEARSPELIELADGRQFELRISPVAKKIGDKMLRMLAYNDSIPGPILRVHQGTTLMVNVVNEGDLEATVHWHGLRLENRYDGTTETQPPMPVGGRFTYRLNLPDPGIFWYHPHIREDYAQEMGLYGNIIVLPSKADYWPPVHRELPLTLDDILLEDGKVAPFSRSHPTHTAMGRFGNVLFVNGESDLSLTARRGEVVRLYLTNTANTRIFDVRLPAARMKLVGGDSGHYEREEFVQSVLIAPSERIVVDVLFEKAGQFQLEHRTPDQTYTLARISVGDEEAEPNLTEQFFKLRRNSDMLAERKELQAYWEHEPDKTISMVAEMDMAEPRSANSTSVYVCPMDPDVVSYEPVRCPKCGMKLVARENTATSFVCPMHPDVGDREPGRCPNAV